MEKEIERLNKRLGNLFKIYKKEYTEINIIFNNGELSLEYNLHYHMMVDSLHKIINLASKVAQINTQIKLICLNHNLQVVNFYQSEDLFEIKFRTKETQNLKKYLDSIKVLNEELTNFYKHRPVKIFNLTKDKTQIKFRTSNDESIQFLTKLNQSIEEIISTVKNETGLDLVLDGVYYDYSRKEYEIIANIKI